jgi:ferredoxin-NADP reductase
LTVQANTAATPTSRIVRLALDGLPFPYEAGQAAWLAAVPDGAFTPYSLASSPEDTARQDLLEFLVKVDRSTRFGARVTALAPGDRVVVRGPAGSFVLPGDLDRASLLFIAGGTGIAPLRSMIRHALDAGFNNRLTLLYSARTPEEFAYLTELRGLAAQGALELTLTLTGEGDAWAHNRGRIDRRGLAPFLAGNETLAFLCGPPSMLAEVSETLKVLGLPDDQIRMETW